MPKRQVGVERGKLNSRLEAARQRLLDFKRKNPEEMKALGELVQEQNRARRRFGPSSLQYLHVVQKAMAQPAYILTGQFTSLYVELTTAIEDAKDLGLDYEPSQIDMAHEITSLLSD